MKMQKIIDRETKRIIEKVRSEILGFYNLYRLDLDSLCRHLGISLLEGEYEDENVSGALTKNDGYTIVINSNHSLPRKRFTIAHELGHYYAIENGSEIAKEFMEQNGNLIKDYLVVNRSDKSEIDENNYQVERQANMIGASILMPDEMVKSLVNENLDIPEMAIKFGVSESAMSYRLKILNFDPMETLYS
jgi:Zn-dependent peptidase ImmA (M78 family)